MISRFLFLSICFLVSSFVTLCLSFSIRPFWISYFVIHRLPLERLHLYQTTESTSFGFCICLRILSSLPLFFYYTKQFQPSSWLANRKRGPRIKISVFLGRWRRRFFLILWLFEFQRDLSIEEDLWWSNQETSWNASFPLQSQGKYSGVFFRELTPNRIFFRRVFRFLFSVIISIFLFLLTYLCIPYLLMRSISK